MELKEKKEFEFSLKLLAKSSVVVFFGILISKLFTYLYKIIVARQYGPEVYGLLALSLMIAGWSKLLSEMGLSHGLLRFIPLFRGEKKENEISFIFRRVFMITATLSILVSIFVFSSAELISIKIFKNESLIIFLKLFSFVIPLTVISGVLLAVIKSYEKVSWFSFIENIVSNTSKFIFIAILIFIGVNASSVGLSYIMGGIVVLFIAYYVSKEYAGGIFTKIKIGKKERREVFSKLFSYSWPLIFSGIIFSTFYWVDSILIGIFKGVEDVGLYNAAIPIALLITISKDLFKQLFMPLVTREYGQGNIRLVKQLSQQINKWIFIISFPLVVLIILFPGTFLNILFGKDYLAAENALRFLAISAFFTTIFELSKDLISMKGNSRIILYDVISGLMLNIALNLFFVPKYGINGAGFATMTSIGFLNALFVYQSWKYFRIVPIKREVFKIVLASLLPIIVLLIFKELVTPSFTWILVALILFLVIYIVMMFILRCLDENDIFIINLTKNKILKCGWESPSLETEKDL